jgi:uncharacterized Fe-S cluster-containing radical SAM superfamily protein
MQQHILIGIRHQSSNLTFKKGSLMSHTELVNPVVNHNPLDFLWLELTNQCNLRCVHCYAESGPNAKVSNALSTEEYAQLLVQSFELGCRKVQFIGGEPTLNKDLEKLINVAAEVGYEFIEVFSNLTHLSDELLQCLREHGVRVATSVYAASAEAHDAITKGTGSFARTIANLRKLVALGIGVRVGLIEMAQNAGLTDETLEFLRNQVGVQDIKVDHIRPFGRAGEGDNQMQALCGACAGGTLCIGSDGRVSPCIMSKAWTLGSVRSESFAAIVSSQELTKIRAAIRSATVGEYERDIQELGSNTCEPQNIGCPPLNKPPSKIKTCGPDVGCPPLNQCGPIINKIQSLDSKTCGPDVGCRPLNECGPIINKISSDSIKRQ